MMSELTTVISELNNEDITQLSNKFWSPNTLGQWMTFNSDIIKDIYRNQIFKSSFNYKHIMILELSQYLENYLWPNYIPNTNDCFEHLMSIVAMINEKSREKVDVWQTFQNNSKYFSDFMSQITHLIIDDSNDLSIKERIAILLFLIHCFNSVEVDLIRNEIQKYVSLPIWCNLSDKRLAAEFENFPKLRKYWNAIQKKDKQMNSDLLEKLVFQRKFLANLIKQFFKYLSMIPSVEEVINLSKNMNDIIHYCERFLELLIDLEALLPTRRFFNSLLDDMLVISVAKCSNLNNRPLEGNLFHQLLEMLKFYANFEIDDITGEALTERKMMKKHYENIINLQKVVFKAYPELRELYISNVSAIDTRTSLSKHLKKLNESQLINLASLLNFGDEKSLRETCDTNLLIELIVSKHERCLSQLKAINEMPIYPSEIIIWDESLVSSQFTSKDECFALPKLNLQFLTLHDYLLRNFHLFRLESTYEIRQDIEDSVSRMKPWRTEDGGYMFGGWARMGLAIDSLTIVEVGKPNIGEKHPSRVRADIVVNLNVRREIKNEWESLRKHDVCFLICVRPTAAPGTAYHYKEPFIPQVGLTYVRGCEIEGMLDPQGKIVDETSMEKPFYNTDNRSFRVWLDCNQYQIDMDDVSRGHEDVYDTFNIIIRRKPKENNFKAVLETIRDLMNTECVVPEWLRDVILGYGDPSAAHYSNMPSRLSTIDFYDTFIDFEHLKQSFGNNCSNIDSNDNDNDKDKMVPPFKITFQENNSIVVTPYVIPNRGPYYIETPKKNMVRFTATQIEAIKSGIQPGLTLVVGPPGTGKTDIAVQIISTLYHNFPDQRTLIVTHSNQALNALFEKIMALDIDERHLLRLGHGEESLETDKDFSRYGRVNYVLSKRLELLNKVTLLASSMAINSDVSYTCETAGYFYLHHVLSRWEEFLSKLSDSRLVERVNNLFPFAKFFEDAPQPLFKGITFEEDLEIARGCFRYIKKIFTQLDEFKAFEMLRSGLDRSNYLLVREAKIIAMTCTHAALKRKELVNVGFQYDNILMEESAQILEIETFIPLLLQNPEHGHNRLKRFIMIGDHLQLPPVIKNLTFQKFSNMEQSLFTRLVRLGVPTVDLDSQGRSRPSIRSLYNWRYKNLGDLPHVLSDNVYQYANSGFRFEYQLINVDDFNGVGESEPVPYFYQNLAEAEYIVGTFMYMRLLGYSAEKISILTTYNGQKHLIRDVIKQRCSSNPFIGQPYKVTTVDKYQGQQNDYILLSLVRTKTVGHIRDVRRLIVAMSRARLGLYIFARTSLFRSCFELRPTFKLLCERPLQLHIIPFETLENNRKVTDIPDEKECLIINNMTEMVQFVYQFYQRKIEEWKSEKPEIFNVLNNNITNKQEDNQMDSQNMNEQEITFEKQSNEEEFEFEKLTENDDGMNDNQDINISDNE